MSAPDRPARRQSRASPPHPVAHRQAALDRTRADDLTIIPGIGPSMAVDLRRLGFRRVSDLATADPEEMYQRLCRLTHCQQDRCVLYVFRCAVYFASRTRHRKDLLLWWNWKDRRPRTAPLY